MLFVVISRPFRLSNRLYVNVVIFWLMFFSSCMAEFPCPTCTTQTATPRPTASSSLLVFVSCSLGEATLKKLYQDVSRAGGRLVMRGLYKNSFRASQKRIHDLGITVDIDPPLFEKFHITHVPTFVRVTSLDGGSHDRLQGNVTLRYALDLLGNK